MTHEEALKEAVRKIWVPMWHEADTGTVLQIIDETVFELGQAIAAYLEARGAVLCEKQDTWFDPVRNVTLHAALTI